MTHASRRQFLHAALAAGAGIAGAAPAPAITPIRRAIGTPHLRLSIAAYSFRKYLDLKNPSMTLDDFAELAAGLDLDAIEPTAYYFPKTTPEYLAHLKGKCARLGLDISSTAVGNNFCTPDAAKHKEELAKVREWIDHSARLGAKTLRIFAGYVAKGETEEQARGRCIEAIQESCDYAGKQGVILALENHGGITATLPQILAIVQAVKHDWFGVNLDTGNFHTEDPYADLAKLAPYAVIVQIKTEIQRKDQKKEEADLKQIIGILRTVGYRGYVALEYEADEDPKTAVPRHAETLKKLVR